MKEDKILVAVLSCLLKYSLRAEIFMDPLLALIEVATSWWDKLSLAQQLFYGIGLLAGFIALLLVVVAMVGMDHDDAIDAAAGDAHDSGGIFSTKPLTGFFLGFGWAGGWALDQGWTVPAALLAATLAGSVMMGVIVALFRTILSMKSDGTVRIENAVGSSGTVYITVQPNSAPGGQVTVSVQGRQETYDALTDSGTPLASGTQIRVTAVVAPRTVQVKPL